MNQRIGIWVTSRYLLETRQHRQRKTELSLDDEIAQLILHGLLHLCGYDHETDNGEMNRLELKLRRSLGKFLLHVLGFSPVCHDRKP